MQKEILKTLDQIEAQNNVKILYACESGSRAWGFPSPDSDYDVRYLYIRPVESYLKLFSERDVIEGPIDEVKDFVGWDLQKALKLLMKGNAPLIEWVRSPIVYPVLFKEVYEGILVPGTPFYAEFQEILKIKAEEKQRTTGDHFVAVDKFIDEFFNESKGPLLSSKEPVNVDEYDNFFLECLRREN